MTKGTRENIINAFLRLAFKFPNRSLFSFSEIAAEACIARQTIYKNHFNNPEEIISYICSELNEKLDRALTLCLDNHLNSDPLESFSRHVLPLLFQYRKWLNILYSTASGSILRIILKKQYLSWVNDNLELKSYHLTLPKEMLNDIFVTMILATIETWLTQPMPVPLDVFSSQFLLIFQTQFQITYK